MRFFMLWTASSGATSSLLCAFKLFWWFLFTILNGRQIFLHFCEIESNSIFSGAHSEDYYVVFLDDEGFHSLYF